MRLDTTLLDKNHPGLSGLYTFYTAGMWAHGWMEPSKKLYELSCIGARLTNDLSVVRKLFERYNSRAPDDIQDGVYKLVNERLYPLDSENNIVYSLPYISVDLGTLHEVS